jgi:hypothetical protein
MRYGTVSTCRTSCNATDTFAESAPRTTSFSVFSTAASHPIVQHEWGKTLWVTCGRRLGKDFLTLLQIGLVRSRVRPVCAARVAAGPNAVRGSGPNPSHAFKDALTLAGSPDPRNDRICITSFALANLVELVRLCCCRRQQFRLGELLATHHHGPSHSRDLVGERDSGDFDRPASH